MASSWASARTLFARSLKRSNGPISVPLTYISDDPSSGSDYTFGLCQGTAKYGTLAMLGDPCGQRKPSPFGVDAHDPHREGISRLYHLVRIGHTVRSELAHVNETLHALGDTREGAIRHHPRDRGPHW